MSAKCARRKTQGTGNGGFGRGPGRRVQRRRSGETSQTGHRTQSRFRTGSSGACEAQLWEFTAPPNAGDSEPAAVERVAAESLDEALQYLLQRHPDFVIVKVDYLGLISMLSGSPLD